MRFGLGVVSAGALLALAAENSFAQESSSGTNAVPAGWSQWGVGCYNRICVGIDADGKAYHFDLNDNQVKGTSEISGAKGPIAVACDNTEYCAAIDSSGQVWKGGLRPPGRWEKATQLK